MAGEASSSTDLEGRILFSASRAAYVLDPDGPESLDSLPIHEPLFAQSPSSPLLALHRVSSGPSQPSVTHFRVQSYPASPPPDPDTSPVLICFPCKLSFLSGTALEAHAAAPPHSIQLTGHQRYALKSTSAILQSGPTLSFLCPVSEEDLPRSEDENSQDTDISAQELARNLYLASELSASRLLEQVSAGSSLYNGQQNTPSFISMNAHHNTARNSCKTLKCPKCNWHYKYQETLEIHMKEKHPDSETTCIYCLHNRVHPKLARGETYGCGYKPYRCEICKYSTTTKGNLSIHMQSDKHLNNVQELQAGGQLVDPSTLIHRPSPASPARPPSDPSIPSFRCEPCKYETPVARNLRIHMTSDKHAHNMALLGHSYPPSPMPPMSPMVIPGEGEESGSLLDCMVCGAFSSDSLEAVLGHVAADRSQPAPGDISFIAGHHCCHLCQYKTHLKANFHLHTKTDKHLQRLTLVNHLREGGPQNEWKLALISPASSSSLQIRCNSCLDLLTSEQAAVRHCISRGHLVGAGAWKLVHTAELVESRFRCRLCPTQELPVSQMRRHLGSSEHAGALQTLLDEADPDAISPNAVLSISDEGKTGATTPDMGDAIHCCAWCNFTAPSESAIDSHVSTAHGDEERGEGVACPLCQALSLPNTALLETHLFQEHNVPAEGVKRLLSLLPSSNSNVPDSTSSDEPSTPVKCPVCTVSFSSDAELSGHRVESGHVESEEREGVTGFACWACEAFSPSLQAFQSHFRSDHEDLAPSEPGCVSQKHAYSFRCKECSLAFKTCEGLEKHSLYHQMRASTRCAICQRNFRTIPALRRHVEAAHSEPNSAEPASSTDKYRDPNRPFKCQVCRESFTQKNILVVHYNSVSHLHKAKKLMETYGPALPMDPDTLAALARDPDDSPKPAHNGHTPSNNSSAKPYKCNLCNVSYSQSSTLDIHMRSVAHLSKLGKMESGREGPAKEASATQPDDPSALFASLLANPFLAAQFSQLPLHGLFNCTGCGSIFSSPEALATHHSSACPARPERQTLDKIPGAPFKKALQNLGFDLVMQYCESQQQRKRKATEEGEEPKRKRARSEEGTSAHPELGKRECKFCGAEYSSIWVLKAHHEIAHPEQTNVSLEQIETVGEALKDETEPAESEKEEVKPEVKAIKEEPKPTRPESSQRPMDMSSLAGMMNPAAVAAMLGAFNPAALMMPNPFNPFANPFMPMMGGMDFSRSMDWDASGMNELMKMAGLPKTSSQSQLHAQAQAQQSIQNAAALAAQQGQKRARTRITDDQLKILREYFDINNSPTEQQIEEMSRKSGLPLKVIKHWFRNTLFKERQRNKDSPYNFNNAPTMGIDLEEYEKTGEARIIKVDKDGQEQVETAQASSSTTTPQKDKDDKSGDKDDDEEEGKLVIAEKPAPSIHQDRQEKITLTPPKASAEQLSAQETLRRLTAMPGLGNMAYPTSAPNPFSALLLAQTSGMNELMNAGFTSNENLSRPHPTVSESGSSSRLTPNHLPHPGGTGRRANRTRFSDYQLKTLQEFFERQAYPKDDDLEQLSKQLQLSPRVIVVWFQNARQKARKVYENSSAAASTDTGERFTKTPGCNFQCKGCNLVFQRYYELIQHQQKHCFRDSEAAAKPKRGAPISQYHCDLCQVVFSAKHQLDDHLKLHAANPSLKVGSAHHHVEEGNSSEGEGSYCRSRTSTPHDGRAHSKERRTLGFNKRCPFCGILFYSADSMESHLNKRHAEQRATMDVNVHLLPDAEEVPTITTSANYEGNGESSGIGHLSFGSLMRNSPSATESMDMLKRLSEGAGAPLDLSRALKTETEPTLGSRSGSPHMSLGLSVGQSDGDEDGFSYTASPSPQHHSAGSTTPSGFPRPPTKRYRTHLSPMQVSVMKHLFREYKTPSMTECDLLGSAIGLHKRVVQVWFQKAKGRKAKAAQGLDPKLEEFRANQNHCSICSVTYTPKHSLQDHIFTREHIEKVKVILNESGEKRSKLKESRAETALGTNPAAYYAAASGIPNVPGMGMGGFFYDANLLGTPVHLLQIPADVMSRIKAAMREGKTDNCRFTQDGKRLSDLPNSAILTNNDVPLISEKDIDVGWGCRKCETVFPSAEGFATHVQMVCGTPAPAFRLTQTHYLCRPCNTHYGRQGKALENDSLGPPPTIPQLRPGESGCEEGAESKGDVTSHAAETAGLHWDANAASNYASAYLPLEKAESSGMLGETDASVYEPASKLFHPSPASSLTSQYYSSAMYGGGGLAYGMGPATGLYGSASPASGSSYYRALKGSAPYAYFPTNTAPAAPNYYGSSYTGQGLDAAYGAAAYTAYGAQAAYGSGYYPGYGSCAPTSPASPTTYTLAQLPPSTAPSLEFPQPNSSPFPKSDPSKKGKSKKKKAPNPSPSPEGDFERVFIWDLDETCILLDSVINGTYAAKFSKDSRMVAQLNSIGIQMEEIVASLAESSFHYGELEECDQVQIEDAAIDDPSQDMGYGNLEGSGNGGLCFAPPPGLRGGVDWMRKLSYRYRRIRDLYALYKDNPEGLLGAKSEAWLSLKTELELLTDKWTPLAKSPLSLIANRAGYVNVVVTSHHLVPAVVKALLFGLAPSIPIENIYSARKVGREAILERVMGRFGKKATYVVVGSGREETGLGRALPHWPVNCHDHLATLTHALDMFL